jgi:hypothetical protein
MENEKIKIEARALLDKFGKDLEHIKISDKFGKIGELRIEKELCLLLEKGSWN